MSLHMHLLFKSLKLVSLITEYGTVKLMSVDREKSCKELSNCIISAL